jgi:hypothetical protein
MPVNEDPISANPTNPLQLLTGGNDYNCTTSLLGFYTTGDGGATWTHTCMNVLPGTVGLGDPALGYDRNNTAYIVGLDGSPSFPLVVALEKSTDNGTTWSSPQIAVHPAFSSGMVDKPWLAIDTTATSPYVNTLYISVTSFSKDGTQGRITVSHSSDGGTSWRTAPVDVLQTYPDVDQFSDLAIGKDGAVYVTWMHCFANGPEGDCGGTNATMYFAKSTDGGNTWSKPAAISSVRLVPDTCPSSIPCFYGTLPNTTERVSNIPAIGVDNSTGPHAGNLYVVMYNWTGSQMQVEVVTSSDGGTTWGTPVLVAPPTAMHDQFFPWLSVDQTGIVYVTWLDRRNDPANISYQPFAVVSLRKGVGFGPGVKLSQNLSNPNNDGLGGTFMGDYTGNTSVGMNKLYVSWMNGTSGAGMQDEVSGLFGVIGNGVDVSESAGDVSDDAWNNMVAAGVQFVAVAAWMGCNPSGYALAQLEGAQQSQFGLGTAAYALLSYLNGSPTKSCPGRGQSGIYQIDQAIEAAGGKGSATVANLKFIAVDVEPCCMEFVDWQPSHTYALNARITDPAGHFQVVTTAGISGSTAPTWNDSGGTTIDGTVMPVTWTDKGLGVITQADRVDLIRAAVKEVQLQGLHPVIYTSRGNWSRITGNCNTGTTNNCSDLIALPLWDIESGPFTAPWDGLGHCGDGVEGLLSYTCFPKTAPPNPLCVGWRKRSGNQYDLGLRHPTKGEPCNGNTYFGVGQDGADLDFFDPMLFQ